MPTVQNPISAAYDILWASLVAFQPFTKVIREGPNTRVNMAADGFTPPVSAQPGDRSSVKIGVGRLLDRPYQRDSIFMEIRVGYPIEVNSGQFGIGKIDLLNTVILQALMTADGAYPGQLGHRDLIERWEMAPADQRMKDALTKRPEWSCYQQINLVLMPTQAAFLTNVYS